MPLSLFLYRFASPLGMLTLAGDTDHITQVRFGEWDMAAPHAVCETPLLGEAYAQIISYLKGERKAFTLPLRPEGTAFQLRVWEALKTIPYGETRAYGQIAAQIGSPKASRAVGLANNRNPISLIIPCHRVIGMDGSLVGYGGGLENKRRLLELERGARPFIFA